MSATLYIVDAIVRLVVGLIPAALSDLKYHRTGKMPSSVRFDYLDRSSEAGVSSVAVALFLTFGLIAAGVLYFAIVSGSISIPSGNAGTYHCVQYSVGGICEVMGY